MAFAPEIVDAVLHHMNDDHTDDNLLIVRAFGPASAATAITARMSSFDADGGRWSYEGDQGSGAVDVPWPSGRISERPEIRREVVFVYRAACAKLGVEPRAEEQSRPHGGDHGGTAH